MKKYLKKPKVKKICIRCNKEFFVYPYRIKEAKYCSHKCRRVVPYRNCLICKKEFKPHWTGYKTGKGKYCSYKCFIESEKGRSPWNKGIKAKDDIRIAKFVNAGHEAMKGRPAWNRGMRFGKSNWIRLNGTHDYRNLHKRVTRKLGKVNLCQKCGRTDLKIYHWANISGRYLNNREDWIRLCPKCHMEMDNPYEYAKA